MLIFRPTARLAKALRVKRPADARRSTAKLGDWFGDLIEHPAPLIVALNVETRAGLLLPFVEVEDLPEVFRARLQRLLIDLGVPRDDVTAELAACEQVDFAKTNDRSALGALNQLCLQAEHSTRVGRSRLSETELDRMSLRLSQIPHVKRDPSFADQAVRLLFSVPEPEPKPEPRTASPKTNPRPHRATPLHQYANHPSPIAARAIEYIESGRLTGQKALDAMEVLLLFLNSLTKDGNYDLTADDEVRLTVAWNGIWGGAIANFVDWFLPRKVLGADDIARRAPAVMRDFLKWCYDLGDFDRERFDDFMEALPRGKSKEVARLQKAAELLYLVHTPDPGAWLRDEADVVRHLIKQERLERVEDGYYRIERIANGTIEVTDVNGDEDSLTLFVGEPLARVLKVGDVACLSLGLRSDGWTLIGSGGVYSE